MNISPELFMAVLSMDAYNRGYESGIGGPDGLGSAIGTMIGNASISYASDSIENSEERTAGFYAVAYQWNGETVISDRGTDNLNPLAQGSGFWNGWTLGPGDCRPRRRHSGWPTKTS